VRTGLSPHAPYTVSDALFRAVAEQSRQEQWPLAVHVAESHAETAFVRDASGPFADALRARGIVVSHKARSPIAWLDDCGILSCRPLLIHAIQVDGEDIGRIADTGAAIAHCPISNLKLGHGVAPLDAFLTAGIPTGLGTDSVASNDRMDLLGEARQAALLQAMRRGLPDALGAHDALSLATLGGAAALGLADRIGSLEIGKDADLAAFSLNAADARPVHDPAVTLVHVLAGSQPAMLVVVAGRELVRDGALIDADATRQGRIELLGDRLRAWRTRFLAT
jgi:5-methylthioadenosine/S-adenosylhomocysteine deaminase